MLFSSPSKRTRSPVWTPSARRTSNGSVTCPLLVIFACFCTVLFMFLTLRRRSLPWQLLRPPSLRMGSDYSYLSASAGSTLAADQEGYSVAMKETPMATRATSRPSTGRGAKGT